MTKHSADNTARFRAYLWWSTVLPVFTVVALLSLFGYGMSFVIGRPWYEGVIIGGGSGAFFMSALASNENYRYQWIQQARLDFEEEEQHLERAWQKEQARADDEYTGW